jgi:hypothetical protein
LYDRAIFPLNAGQMVTLHESLSEMWKSN